MKNQTIQKEATLFAASHPQIITKLNMKSLLVSLVGVVAGIVLLSAALRAGEGHDTLAMSGLSVGVLLVVLSLWRLFIGLRQEVYRPTGSVVHKHILFFDSALSGSLQEYIRSGEFPASGSLRSVPNGCVKMEVLSSADGHFAGVQLFEFEPYVYEPVTSVYYYTGAQANALRHFVESVKTKSA